MMPENVLVKMKTGTIKDLEHEVNEVPDVALDEGSVYFAVDVEEEIGKIVYDAPDGAGGVKRIVMGTHGEFADNANFAKSAEHADALSSSVYLDGVDFDGTNNVVHYTECISAEDSSVKEIDKNDLVVAKGSHIIVKFLSNNTAENITLKVGDIIKPIYHNGSPIAADKIKVNTVLDLVFDKSLDAWLCVGGIDPDIPEPIEYDLVNLVEPGLMSPIDKNKLDTIEYNANYLSVEGAAPIEIETNDNIAIVKHSNSGVAEDTYGTLSTTAINPAFGAEITIPAFTVDEKGHITAAAAHTVKIPDTEAGASMNGLMTPLQVAKLDSIAYDAQPGTVTNIETGAGLIGGPITETGTIKVNLASEQKLDINSVDVSQKTNAERLYPIDLDKSGHLSAYIPWTDTIYQTKDGSSSGYLISSLELNRLDELHKVSFTSNLNSGVKIGTITVDDIDTDLYSTENTWIPMTGATLTENGVAGYVSTAPVAGQINYYLAGDGTWKGVPSAQQDMGLISYSDLSKLQNLPDFSELTEIVNEKVTILQISYDGFNNKYLFESDMSKKEFFDILKSAITNNDILILADGEKRFYFTSLSVENKATFVSNTEGLGEVLVTECSESTTEAAIFSIVQMMVDKADRADKDGEGNVITETYLTTDNKWLASTSSNGTMSILDYNKLQGIEHEANKTVLHNDAYITLYPSEGGATTQGEVTIGHKTSEASGNYGQYNSTNTEIISQSSESGYYKFDSVGFTVDGAGHITNAKQHEVRIPVANATRDGLISSLDYLKISEDVVSRVTATAPIVATIENGNELTISHTTTGANSLKGESTDLPALQFGDNFKTLRESVDQYGLTTLLEEKEVTIPSYTADNRRNGLMSSLDKMKLDAFDEAWNYATTDYVNAALSGLDPMVFKGVVDSYSELPQKTNPDGPNYDPDLSNGWTYRVGTAGEYNGRNLSAGDIIIMTNDGWFGISTDSNGALFKASNVFVNNQMLLADGTLGMVKSVPINPTLLFEYYDQYPTLKITVGGAESNLVSIDNIVASDAQYGFTKLTNLPLAQLQREPDDLGVLLAATPKGVDEAIKLLDITITDSYIDEQSKEVVEVSNLFANKTLATLSEVDGIIQATFQPIQLDMTQITTGILPIAQGGTGTSLLTPNTLITVETEGQQFVSTNHYIDNNVVYINQDSGFTSSGLNISNILPIAEPNLYVNGDSIITDGLDVFNYTKSGSALNLHGGTNTGTSIISFYPDAPIHDENNNTDIQQLIDTGFAAVGGFIKYDVGHDLTEHNSVTQGGTYSGDSASLTIGINGEPFNPANNYYHNSRLILTAPAPMHLQFDSSNGTKYNIPTVDFSIAGHFSTYENSPLIATSTPNVYVPNETIKMGDGILEVGDYLGNSGGEPSGTIFTHRVEADEFIGSLTGNADTATQWTAPTTTYVDLSTPSTSTILQGNEGEPVALGIDGTLGIANGGTGGTTVIEARQSLGIGNAQIYAATCTTSGSQGAKVATCADLTTVPQGTLISVTFENINTAATNFLTLNLNNTGALPIRLFRNGVAAVLDEPTSISRGPHIFRKENGYWYVVDSIEEKVSAVSSSAYILAKSSISANRIIVTEDPTEGYVALGSGVSFNINYPIFYTTVGINSSATTKAIYSHYGDIDFSSMRNALSGQDFSTIYIKGTLEGNIVTTTTDFLTTVEPEEKDGCVYIPIANTNNGTTGWFYNTGNVLTFKNGALVPIAAGAGEGEEGAIIEEIIKLLPESSTNPEDAQNRIFKWDDHTVTIYSDNVTEESTQFVSAPQESFVFNNSTQAMTLEQMEPLSSAIIIDGGQGVTNGQGWFKLVALSDVPEVETYIRVVYKYTVDDNQSSIDSAAAYAQQAQAALQSIESLTTHMKYYPVTISTLTEDNSNENYPYKYIVPMTGVAETDWVDASWVTDQDWAVEAVNNQVILHFSQNITDPIVVTIYWTSCSLYTAS